MDSLGLNTFSSRQCAVKVVIRVNAGKGTAA